METTSQLLDRLLDLAAQRDKYKKLSETDQLTRLPNRRGLEVQVDTREGWFISADLNGFKRAQDSHKDGHAYGDRILSEFAEFLVDSIRFFTDLVVSRSGGDEFLIWCPTSFGAYRICNRIRSWQSEDGAVGCSAGVDKDIRSADFAMYRHKQELRVSR